MNKSTIIWIVSAIYGFTFGLVSNVYGLSTLQMLSLIMMSAAFLVFYVWINLPSVQSTPKMPPHVTTAPTAEETLIAAQAGASTIPAHPPGMLHTFTDDCETCNKLSEDDNTPWIR